jgi:hypothetical protein
MAESDGDTHLLPKLTCPKSLRGSMNAGVSPEGGGGWLGSTRHSLGETWGSDRYYAHSLAMRRQCDESP